MRYWLILFAVSAHFYSYSQNLILNGGMEEVNTCTEYDAECAPEAWISQGWAVNYVKDPRRAYAGRYYIEFAAGHEYKAYQRSGFRTRLLCALGKGQVYRLTLRVKSLYPVLDSIGVYFAAADPLVERKPIHRLSPSVYFATNNSFTDDTSWQQVSIMYTASGGERYLFIANYSVGDVNGNIAMPKNRTLMVAIDAVSMLPVDSTEALCADSEESRESIYHENARHQMLTRSLRQTPVHTPLPLIRPQSMRVVKVEKLILPDVLFAIAKKDLLPGSQPLLDSLCRQLEGKIIDSLVLTGHTDNTGSREINAPLALQRAQAVAAGLKNCSWLSGKPVIIRGAASDAPVAPNDTPEGRSKNRRVELMIYTRQ